jgi:hypothetical protein
VYTPARTPVRSKLGLSGTPSRVLRSQFDDAADAISATAAPGVSSCVVDSSSSRFAAFQDDGAAASASEEAQAALAAASRAVAPVVYTPARTPVRSKLGLSGTPSRSFFPVAATPVSDYFFTPMSCLSPSTPLATLDSPASPASAKYFR